jgi:ribosome biogenesis GTPase
MTLTGRILKGIGGIYNVSVPGHGLFSCPARGLFKNLRQTPIPGDLAVISSVDFSKRTAYLYELLPRTNELIRPRAANVTQALVVFSVTAPEVNLLVVDTMLAYMYSLDIVPILCLNKVDLADINEIAGLKKMYAPAGCKFITVSAKTKEGLDDTAGIFAGNTTILAGPSGVGKSSIINALFPELNRETGELSAKIQRGKNTTRSCELFEIADNGFIADTPGFTSFDATLLSNLPKEGIDTLFPEFEPHLGNCYYGDCMHITEHDCAVKEHIGETIPLERYENYKIIVEKISKI